MHCVIKQDFAQTLPSPKPRLLGCNVIKKQSYVMHHVIKYDFAQTLPSPRHPQVRCCDKAMLSIRCQSKTMSWITSSNRTYPPPPNNNNKQTNKQTHKNKTLPRIPSIWDATVWGGLFVAPPQTKVVYFIIFTQKNMGVKSEIAL